MFSQEFQPAPQNKTLTIKELGLSQFTTTPKWQETIYLPILVVYFLDDHCSCQYMQ